MKTQNIGTTRLTFQYKPDKINSLTPYVEIDLDTIAKLITGPQYKKITEQIRQAKTKEERPLVLTPEIISSPEFAPPIPPSCFALSANGLANSLRVLVGIKSP